MIPKQFRQIRNADAPLPFSPRELSTHSTCKKKPPEKFQATFEIHDLNQTSQKLKRSPSSKQKFTRARPSPPPKIGIQIAGQLTLQFSIERDRHDIEIVGSRATRTTGPILIIFNVADFRKQTAIPASGIPS